MLIPSIKTKHKASGGWRQIDFPGAFLFLAATILLIYALQSASATYGWSSSIIIGSLVGSGVSLILFIMYELRLPRYSSLAPFFPLPLLVQPDISLLMM